MHTQARCHDKITPPPTGLGYAMQHFWCFLLYQVYRDCVQNVVACHGAIRKLKTKHSGNMLTEPKMHVFVIWEYREKTRSNLFSNYELSYCEVTVLTTLSTVWRNKVFRKKQ